MIDLCVAINGKNLDVQLPMFFESFYRVVNQAHLIVHVVDKGIGEKERDYLNRLRDIHGDKFIIYDLKEPYVEIHTPRCTPVSWCGGDTAYTCKWMMENCGTNDWVIMSHFDIMFKGDIINVMAQHIADDVGMIGQHSQGIVFINRIAYGQTFVEFWPMSGCFAVPFGSPGVFKVRHERDPRCFEKTFRVEQFDVAELLEINIQARGWKFVAIEPSVCRDHRDHIVCGSGYNNNQQVENDQRNRVIGMLNSIGVQPL
jgi:hypothetical protein